MANVRRLCSPRAAVTIVLAVDPDRDGAEAHRLGLPLLDGAHFGGPLAEGYAAAGLRVTGVRSIGSEELVAWPSSWARRLAFGRPRPAFQIEARAAAQQLE
jgi:hypothetical protein